MKRFFKKWGNWIALGVLVLMVALNDVSAMGFLPVIFGTNAVAGKGTEFKRGDGSSSESFTKIAEVNNISGPNITRELIDATSLDSTAGYMEFIAGFREGGEVTIELNFTLDEYDSLLADIQSDSSVNYQIVLPDSGNTTLQFAAYCTSLGLNVGGPADKVTVPATFKITGAVTLST